MSLARTAVVSAVAAGALGAFILLRTQRDPCGALLRRYARAYDGAKACTVDAECVLDALPAGGPGVCDRSRAVAASRAELERVERAWAAASCPAPGERCPPTAGAGCRAGRCVTLLAR